MKSGNAFNIPTDWYDIWMKQSKEFFETADKNLKGVFENNKFVNPEEHMQKIQQWMDTLKKQWEFAMLTPEQKAYQTYWQMMGKMYQDASDLMLQQWIQRSKDNDPVKTVRELYELWLNCCHEVYQKSLQSKAYQEAYGDFMNKALNIWKSALQK